MTSVLRAIPAALLLLLGLFVGLDLPDLDQHLPFLGHRSALTHSVLAAALLWRRWPAFAGGLAFGIGVHLLADLFPNAMTGYATVKLPLLGSIGPLATYLWLGLNAWAALVLAAVALARLPGLFSLGAAAVAATVALAYLFRTDGGWWALLLIAALTLAVRGFASRRQRSR